MTEQTQVSTADVIILGATPAGIAAAVASARGGRTVILLERSAHIGGLPANGLGATDIATRYATGGFFTAFTDRVLAYYTKMYGADSAQVKDSSGGYHFEPSVAEKVLEDIVAEWPKITILRMRQFDAGTENVLKRENKLSGILILNRETNQIERIEGKVFIDATYEGDLAAAAGVRFRLGREDQREFNEPMAGMIYKSWGGEPAAGSSGWGDNALQAYNYRLPLTKVAANRVTITKPERYDREDYASLADDVNQGRHTAVPEEKRDELYWDGIGKVVNIVETPNGKTDSNNQHTAFVSTDLPEENWPWPTSGWAWRDKFAGRLRDYILGLLWFCQNDPALPEDFRARCSEWGLSRDEYQDNGYFPRQVYVREGRRIEGEYFFTAHDALPVEGGRPPLHADSITSSHYPLDSHAVRKREPGRVNLEGFFSMRTAPYTVPYGVMVPREVEGLLVPVAASSTHIGFSTLRMEPCWMALGEAAGTAASLALAQDVPVRRVEIPAVQQELLRNGAVLIFFRDVLPSHPHFAAVQALGLRGLIPEWTARPDEPVTPEDAERWTRLLQLQPEGAFAPMTRAEFLESLYRRISKG